MPVTSIQPDKSFANTFIPSSITTFVVAEGITYISGGFYSCPNLTTVIIPNSLNYIQRGAFDSCTSLKYNEYGNGLYLGNDSNPYHVLVKAKDENVTNLTIHDDVKVIMADAFYDCASLQYNKYDNAIYLGTNTNPYYLLVKGNDGNYTSCNVHSDTKVILGYAFYLNQSLTNVKFPEGLRTINEFAFANTSLESLSIPSTVSYLGSYAFSGCSFIELNLPEQNIIYDYGVFSSCHALTQVTLPEGMTTIPAGMFYNCMMLSNVQFPKTLKYINYGSFCHCNLQDIYLPEGLIGIHSSFLYMEIDNLYLPKSLQKILEYGILTSVNNVHYAGTLKEYSEIAGCLFYTAFIGGNEERYVNYHINGELITDLVITDDIKNIQSGTFYGATFNSITIDVHGEFDSAWTFANCKNLTTITFSKNVTKIGNYIFMYCNNLTAVNFEGTIEEWNKIQKSVTGEYLEEYTLPDGTVLSSQIHIIGWDIGTDDFTIYCTDGTIAKADQIQTPQQ